MSQRRTTLVTTAAVIAIAAVVASVVGCGERDDKQLPDAVQDKLATAREKHPTLGKRKVLLLGFDSCDPDLLDAFIRRGKAPNFARMRREGSTGALQSISPLLSPVVWTSIATGMTPERHGILDFVTEVPAPGGGTQKVPVSSKLRQADSMWELIARGGDKVGVVGWLVTYPAEPEPNTTIISERMGLLAYEYGKDRSLDAPQRTYPELLAKSYERENVTIDDLSIADIRPFANVTEEEYAEAYAPRFDPRNLLGNLRLTLATASTFRNMGLRMQREENPRFMACYFEAMDALSHFFMRYAPPQMPGISDADFARYQSAIEANYMWHDDVLGEFMAQADEFTTVIVVSDHGFQNATTRTPDGSNFHDKTGAQWHRTFGVIYAWGYGVQPGAVVRGASIYDVAPTVLASMGYPVPEDMEGKVLTDLFEGGLEYETVPTYFGEQRRERLLTENAIVKEGGAALTPEQEEELARLESLGYTGGESSDPTSTQLNLVQRRLHARRFDEAIEMLQKIAATKEEKGELTPGEYQMLANAHVQRAQDRRNAYLRKQGTYTGPSVEEDLVQAEQYLEQARSLLAKHWPMIRRKMEADGRPELVARGPEKDADMLLIEARILYRRGDLERAEELVRDSLVTKDYLVRTYMLLGEIIEAQLLIARRNEDKAEMARLRAAAIETYENALRWEPRNWSALKDLAVMKLSGQRDEAEMIRNAEEALRHLDSALEIIPRSPESLNNRCIALLRLGIGEQIRGNHEEAQAKLEAALASAEAAIESKSLSKTQEPYPTGQANKAYVLWKLGRLAAARDAAQKALDDRPEYPLDRSFVAALQRADLQLAVGPPRGDVPPPDDERNPETE